MRHLVKKRYFQLTEDDIALVESVWLSEFFIFVDLFFLSLLLSIMTYPFHLSFIIACIIFFGTYTFGTALFYLLKKLC